MTRAQGVKEFKRLWRDPLLEDTGKNTWDWRASKDRAPRNANTEAAPSIPRLLSFANGITFTQHNKELFAVDKYARMVSVYNT